MIFGSCHFDNVISGLLEVIPRLVQAPLLSGKGSVPATLFLLFAGHALCDYPLQGQFLSDSKNRHLSPSGGWRLSMLAHCLIQAGMVLIVTGSIWFAFGELMAHYATDCAKCEGWITSRQDQLIHYGCKILWVLVGLCIW